MFSLCEQTNLQRKLRRTWTEHAQFILSNSFIRSVGRGRGQDASLVVLSGKLELWVMESAHSPTMEVTGIFGILILVNLMCSLVFYLWFGGGENLPRFYLCKWLWELWNLSSFILFVRTLDIQILEFCVCVCIFFS